MDFFGRQASVRGRSRWLLGAFAVATGAVALALAFVLAVIAGMTGTPEGHAPGGVDPVVFVIAAVATAAFIGIAALWRLRGLQSGGGSIAVSMGGERVTGLEQDPLKRRLHNVVEEMAIAAGLPVPEVYVLENEPGINAFAAGLQPADAAVAVTRGALERLGRDELQGVIAHEFSHILNGDMRLNARLMGYTFGLVAVSMLGRLLLRGGAYGGGRVRVGTGRRGGGGAGALLAAGLAMAVLGSIGVLAGRILQAAVSRQREELADASAVQFTRNPAGLANALKRIAASPLSSSVRAVRREEIGHMLFASGRRSLAGLLATHPPVANRIRALDPHWKPGDSPPPLPPQVEPPRSSSAATAAQGENGARMRIPGMPDLPGLDPVAAAAMIGVVDLAMAERVLAMVPGSVHRAVLEPEGAAIISLALLLDSRERPRASQLALLEARLGSAVSDRVAQAAGHLVDLAPTLRLALLDLASPALRHLPEVRRDDLVHLAQRLIELDGEISPHEAAMAAALESRLAPAEPGKADPEGALAMLALLARAGHEDEAEAADAWTQGAAKLEAGGFPLPSPLPAYASIKTTAGAQAAAHAARLAAMQEDHRQLLMAAAAEVVSHDGVIRPAELQLLRTAATALGCPMPPLDL
jgi:Zn-dependent protease with chaperone function/uncharacterized tellurite resistance protein B-like protein